MGTELRKIGRRWVLYTDNLPVYKHLTKYPFSKNKVPYLQNGKLIGIDFYFEKKLPHTIRRVAKGQLPLGI